MRSCRLRRGLASLGLVCLAAVSGLLFAIPDASAAGPPLNVSADPAHGDVGPTTYTGFTGTLNPDGVATTYLFQYGRTLGYGGRSPSVARSVGSGTGDLAVASPDITGLVPGSVYHYRLTATNAAGTTYSDDRTLTTCGTAGCAAPMVRSQAATGVTAYGATLNAEVNPNGGSDATCYFTYSTDPTVTSELLTTPGVNVGHSNLSSPVTTDVRGLRPATTYYVMPACQNDVNQTQGAVVAFSTDAPPAVTTGDATLVTADSARLAGAVTGVTTELTCRFDYGRSARYGGQTAPVLVVLRAGSAGFAGSPSQLAAHAVYHVRAKCSTGAASSFGADKTFVTVPVGD